MQYIGRSLSSAEVPSFQGGGLRTSEGNEHMGGTGKRNVRARGGTPLNDMTFGVHRRTAVS